MNVFSSGEMAICEGMIQDLVDTFGTPLSIYKTSQELAFSQDGNFNFAYPNPQPGTVINYIQQSGTFTARIKYLDNNELELLLSTQNRQDEGQTQLRLLQSKPVVRIKLGADAVAFMGDIDDIKLVTFDNSSFVLFKAPRLHGLFNRNYVTLYLQKTE